MKRVGSIFLCILLGLCLCACNNTADEPVLSTPSSTTTTLPDATTTTTTTGALVVTDPQGTVVTNPDGSPVTTHVATLPTSTRPVTDPQGSTVTEQDGTVQTEVVVPPHITVSTDAQGTTHTSVVPEQTVTTTTTTTTTTMTQTSTSAVTTSTTKPTQQDVVSEISLPAEGYTPDNRIQIGQVSLTVNVVTMEIKNISGKWESADGESYFEYTCYNKNNMVLEVGKIEFGYIAAKSGKVCSFTIPEGTTRVALTDFHAEYWTKLV